MSGRIYVRLQSDDVTESQSIYVSIARNIGNIMKRTHRLLKRLTLNTSERERNRNLTDLYTQMWIEIGQSARGE